MIYVSYMHHFRVNGDIAEATISFVHVHRTIVKQEGILRYVILEKRRQYEQHMAHHLRCDLVMDWSHVQLHLQNTQLRCFDHECVARCDHVHKYNL